MKKTDYIVKFNNQQDYDNAQELCELADHLFANITEHRTEVTAIEVLTELVDHSVNGRDKLEPVTALEILYVIERMGLITD